MPTAQDISITAQLGVQLRPGHPYAAASTSAACSRRALRRLRAFCGRRGSPPSLDEQFKALDAWVTDATTIKSEDAPCH